eukprot:SAG11_NODE_1274_length_5330_cov_5.595106_2_plen_154_part_00
MSVIAQVAIPRDIGHIRPRNNTPLARPFFRDPTPDRPWAQRRPRKKLANSDDVPACVGDLVKLKPALEVVSQTKPVPAPIPTVDTTEFDRQHTAAIFSPKFTADYRLFDSAKIACSLQMARPTRISFHTLREPTQHEAICNAVSSPTSCVGRT